MHWLSKKRNLFVMIVPSFVIYTVYIIASVCIAVYYSFTKYTGIGKAAWNGIENYVRVFHDKFFWISLKNTGIVLILSLLTLTIFGFLLANVLRVKRRGNDLCKALIFSPSIISPIIVGIIWIYILDPEVGILNQILYKLGKEGWMQMWIGGTVLSPYMYAVIFLWRQLGYLSTIFLAGLNMIPEEIYEAAEIDGANAFQKMVYVTVPMARNTFNIVILLIITSVFKIFEFVTQLTAGGPNHLSETVVTYSYTTTFSNGEYGYGMALATVVFIITLILSEIYNLIMRDKEEEQ